MNKKKWMIVICAAVVFVCAAIPVIIAIKNSADEKKLYSSYYNLDNDFIIEAENGSLNQKKNSIEFIKTAYNSGANCVELDLTFSSDSKAYIESDPENITEDTLTLEQVLVLLSKDSLYKNSKIDLVVHSTQNLKDLDELCKKYDVEDRVFLTGLNLNQAKYISTLTKLPFYLSIELEKTEDDEYLAKVFDDISNSKAAGIICEIDEISKLLSDILFENWIKVSFENVNSKKQCIEALKMFPNRIKTEKPYMVLEIVQQWQNEAPVEFYGIGETTEE